MLRMNTVPTGHIEDIEIVHKFLIFMGSPKNIDIFCSFPDIFPHMTSDIVTCSGIEKTQKCVRAMHKALVLNI
jgi:hypothetical protein